MRCAIALVLLAAFAAPADAARVWQGPAPIGPADAYSPTAAVATDGNRLDAWVILAGRPDTSNHGDVGPSAVFGQAAGGVPVPLGRETTYQGELLATARGGQGVIAWGDADTGTARAAFEQPGGTLSAPVDIGPGTASGASINDAGEAAVTSTSGGYPSTDFRLVNRRADGTLTAPLALPAAPTHVLETPTGETILALQDATGTSIYSRRADEPLSSPFAIGNPFPVGLAADATGRVLAVWNDGTSIKAALRAADGTWNAPGTLATGTVAFPVVAMNARGEYVIAWRAGAYVDDAPVSLVTGTLDGTPSAPVTLPSVPGVALSAAIGVDGSAVVAYEGGEGGALVVRRDGLGPFGAPQAPGCAGTEPRALAVADDGTAYVLQTGIGVLHDAFSSAADDHVCEASVPDPRVVLRPRHPIAGRFARVDATGLRRANADITTATFHFKDGGPTRRTGTPGVVLHRFVAPGHLSFKVSSVQTRRYGSATFPYGQYFDADVYRAMQLKAAGRQPLRGPWTVHANAEASQAAQSVTVTVVQKGRVLANEALLLGAETRTIPLPVRHAVAGPATITLRQAGGVHRRVRVRVRP